MSKIPRKLAVLCTLLCFAFVGPVACGDDDNVAENQENQENQNQDPENQNQDPENQNQDPENQNQDPENQNQDPENQNQDPENQNQDPENQNQNQENQNQDPENQNQENQNQNQENQNQNQENQTEPGDLISEMDADEIADACDDLEDHFIDAYADEEERFEEGGCKFSGIFAAWFAADMGADPIEACEDEYQQCLDEDPEPIEDDCELQDWDDAERAECHVTVAEMIECYEEQIEGGIFEIADNFTCEDNLTEDGEPDADTAENVGNFFRAGPVCEALIDDCPAAEFDEN